jgi:FixJ family two-component response regulator
MTAPTAPLVFIVDDDSSVRKSLARLVRAAGFDVETFASAREFLVRPRSDGPSCLVLDVRMPGMTGLDLQETLATAGQRVSIVFITGYPDARAHVKAMKGGAIDFLSKPVNDKDLVRSSRGSSRRETDRFACACCHCAEWHAPEGVSRRAAPEAKLPP